MPEYDGLSNHIRITSDIGFMPVRRRAAWPWALLLGLVVGFFAGILVGCNI